MTNSGKDSGAMVINAGNCTITIWPDTIGTGTVCVRKGGNTLWQKINQDYTCLHTAIEVARLGVQTNIFEA